MLASQITLRRVCAEDVPFLERLYFDTRRHEVSAWGWPLAQQEMFLRMQFDAQRRSYSAAFPNAEDHIVNVDGSAAGRIPTCLITARLRTCWCLWTQERLFRWGLVTRAASTLTARQAHSTWHVRKSRSDVPTDVDLR